MNLLYNIRRIKEIYLIALIALNIIRCNKIVEIDAPANTINEENVYKSDVTAIAVLTGMYANIGGNGSGTIFTGLSSISVLAGLSADELTLFNGVANNKFIAYYKNSLLAASPEVNYGAEFWASSGIPGLYYYIFICNAAIEGLNKSATLTPSVKQQLLGEAKFLRAFFYFYLVNLYGDVPLALTTDPAKSAVLARAPRQEVYQQIIEDLKESQSLLTLTYLNGNLSNYSGSPERVRPTQWAATALLSRVYLYTEDYVNAELQAASIINQNSLFRLTQLNETFLKNSNEAIWQVQPVASGRNTEDAFNFIIPATGPNESLNPVFLSNHLLTSIEPGDQRMKKWIDSIQPVGSPTYYFPYKYKSSVASSSATEYLMILRLAEQYLIRAEARVQQNNLGGAQADLNVIRSRAGLPNTTASTQSALLAAILHERQVELFTELGQRWFDLKRTNNVNAVMNVVTPLKGGIWQNADQLYPIPVADILKNPNLQQNLGY
jgi:starch-binding outer membrane protein, SusD/RagB family